MQPDEIAKKNILYLVVNQIIFYFCWLINVSIRFEYPKI